MVATNLKAETMAMMEKRSGLEVEMNVIIERLTQPSAPGISGNLVDAEGFPRTDIDIPTVRADRNRLSVLKKDYKEITEKIDQNIQLLHSVRLPSKPSPPKDSGSSAVNIGSAASSHSTSAMDVDVNVSIPFALVDEISEASPAAEDGLQLGDQIVKFGSVESSDNLLPKLAAEAQGNRGRGIHVIVMRQGARVHLTLTPRAWQGRGLLGCHFQIL